MPTPSSTQIGAIAENLIATILTIESGGRIAAFKPIADDDGIDLLVYDKDRGKALPLQVKSRTVTLNRPGTQLRGDTAHFQFRIATFNATRYAAAVLVLSSNNGYGMECGWVIPMSDLQRLARTTDTRLVVRASRAVLANDKFLPYRCASRSELCSRLSQFLSAAP